MGSGVGAPAVETVGLAKRFPRHAGWRGLFSRDERTALHGVNLRVERGEVFGLVGPNGAGKTTLMKVLATLIRPSSGHAYINGLDVTRFGTEVRRSIGLIYGDERTFFWRLSAHENLRFYAALYSGSGRIPRERIGDLLDAVGLQDSAHMRMYQYSTGMRQRAAIARGLLSNPEIVFMDEPTRSLDPAGVRDIHELIRGRVLADGRTILLATNNMAEAEALCDRIALINHGAVELMGTIPELARALLAHERYSLTVSDVDGWRLEKLECVPGVLELHCEAREGGGWRIDLAVDHRSDAVPEAIRLVVNAGGSVWSCVPRSLSLEEIFQLTVHAKSEERASAPQEAPA